MLLPPFLEIANATVVRGDRTVLEDLSLQIAQGEQVALLGPNGCGKSTLLKLICHELYPLANAETQVKVMNRSRWDLTELRQKLGVVQNELPGKPMLAVTGREAVLTGFFSSARIWPHQHVTDAMHVRAGEALARVHATALAQQLFGEMSAGQQRRILIARALVASAGCLLLDEPSNALDLAAQHELRQLMMELAAQGTTMLLITHQLADIIPAIGRVVMMSQGRIVADGARADLLTEERLQHLFGIPVRLTERDGILHAW